MSPYKSLEFLLGANPVSLQELDTVMANATGRKGVVERVYNEGRTSVREMFHTLGIKKGMPLKEIRASFREALRVQEKNLLAFMAKQEGRDDFERAANVAREAAHVGKGFFLKKSLAEEILRKANPTNLLKYRGYGSIDELLKNEDVFSAFSALRFVESNEWMHKTFAKFYSYFTPKDFEERAIEVKVLGSEWQAIAEKFVRKKHHNVSHLKEFGVIFINPIAEDMTGAMLRDFTLLLHYFHEVEFYSKLFKRFAKEKGFSTHLKSLLRGDVLERTSVGPGEWLIVQRYLAKENPDDPRLFLPHVNPESMHWARGERDVADLGRAHGLKLWMWDDRDWLGTVMEVNKRHRVKSFDLVDNAMSLVSYSKGTKRLFNYHQHEALWTKLFQEYVGGEEKMEAMLIQNFERGIIKFTSETKN